MQFRIGVNLGDVIAEENNLYGSGVNVAVRLEPLTPPGGRVTSSLRGPAFACRPAWNMPGRNLPRSFPAGRHQM
jgi:hypothetical protein